MVDHQVDRHQRVDLLRIGTELGGGVAHGGEIDHGRDAGKILHQHAGRAVGNFMIGRAGNQPGGDGLDIGLGDGAVVFEAQQVFQHHLHRMRQLGRAGEAILLGLGDGIIGVGLATDIKGRFGLEAVYRGHFVPPVIWCCGRRAGPGRWPKTAQQRRLSWNDSNL